MEGDQADKVHCVPLVCFRMLPTTVIRVTPFFDLLIYLMSAIFQAVVISSLRVGSVSPQRKNFTYIMLSLALVAGIFFSLQNISVYRRLIRNKYAISFKLYDWISM